MTEEIEDMRNEMKIKEQMLYDKLVDQKNKHREAIDKC